MAAAGRTTTRLVWDVPIRLFHWSLVILIAVSILTGGEEGTLFVVHVLSGHLILLLLLYRLLWGFLGSPRARFRDFVAGPTTVLRYSRGFFARRPDRYAGHNPLGGLMVIAFLVVIGLILATGLGAARKDFGLVSPLAALVPSVDRDVHTLLVTILYVMIGLHIAGVIADWLLTRENLVMAMVTGRKRAAADDAPEAPLASGRRAFLAGLPVAALGAWLVTGIDAERLAAVTRRRWPRSGRPDGD